MILQNVVAEATFLKIYSLSDWSFPYMVVLNKKRRYCTESRPLIRTNGVNRLPHLFLCNRASVEPQLEKSHQKVSALADRQSHSNLQKNLKRPISCNFFYFAEKRKKQEG